MPLSDFLGIVAGPARRSAFFPKPFPIPHSGHDFVRQPKSELMREHADLPAMVSFVSQHVAQHFRANWPSLGPAVSAKLPDAAPAAERFREHLRATGGAVGQSGTDLLRPAVAAVQLPRNLQVRSRKPDPLAADIVHVGKDRGNAARVAGRFGSPDSRVEMFDNNLVDAIIGGKDLHCGSADSSMNLRLTIGVLTPGHG